MKDELTFRKANLSDVLSLVGMLSDDELGRHRENPSLPLNSKYVEAFVAIENDANQLVVVADHGGTSAGCLQRLCHHRSAQ